MNTSTLTMRLHKARAPSAARTQRAHLPKPRPALSLAPPPPPPLPLFARRPSVLARHGADDDDGPLPLLRLPRRSEDPVDVKKLKQTPHLGGKTVGEELALIAKQHASAEADARARMEGRLFTASRGGAWEGDVYVGRPGERYDIMQILAAVAFLTPVVGLAIAMATWGTYWGNYTG